MRVLIFLGLFLIQQVYLVEIKVTSQCSYPIWIAAAPNTGSANLNGGTVRLDTGASFTYQIPSNQWAGRMWPKIGCDGSGQNCVFGQSSPPCPSGGCQPPADTKIEFFFPNNFAGQAWYDISLVDGFSLPVDIAPRSTGGTCITTQCRIGLNSCPTNENNGLGDLRVIKNGQTVACLSPCKRWNFPSPYGLGKSETIAPGVNMCCPTPPISPQQCSSGPVVSTNYVQQVRNNCPSAYSYAYDDHAGLHSCPGGTSFDVTFCPNGGGGGGGGGGGPNPPCSQWGWKFYDNYDIQGNDIANVPATDRNACQPACRANPKCRAYSWAYNVCYLKSGGTTFLPNGNVYSAIIC